MVKKEPNDYYMLKGVYLFRNFITRGEALLRGYSTPTPSKLCWEKLPILREQIMDRSLKSLSFYLRNTREACKSQWVLVEILNEYWQKL